MSRRDKVVTLAVVGGILILLGVLSNSWWRIEDGAIKLGLREAKFCAGGVLGSAKCVYLGYGGSEFAATGGYLGLHGSFFRYANLTFWIGMLASLGLFAHAWLMRTREQHRVGYVAGAACVAVVLLAFATIAASSGKVGAYASTGWSLWFAMVGCMFGVGAAIPKLIPTSAVAGARNAVDGVSDRITRAALGPLADLEEKTSPDRKAFPQARVHNDDS